MCVRRSCSVRVVLEAPSLHAFIKRTEQGEERRKKTVFFFVHIIYPGNLEMYMNWQVLGPKLGFQGSRVKTQDFKQNFVFLDLYIYKEVRHKLEKRI